jgi:hypothetical protein
MDARPRRARLAISAALAAILGLGSLAAATATQPVATAPGEARPSELRELVDRYTVDRTALGRRYPLAESPARVERMRRFYDDTRRAAEAVDFESLGVEGRIDAVLLRLRIEYERRLVDREAAWLEQTASLLPFARTITSLTDARMNMETVDPVKAATTLDGLAAAADAASKALAGGSDGAKPETRRAGTNGGDARPRVSRLHAFRAQEHLGDLAEALESWFAFHRGYDPMFTWWTEVPYKQAAKALASYRTALRERGVGIVAGGDEPIVGTPIGRDALVADLASELIPYTPEELLTVGEREFAWCDAEMKKAAAEMGVKDWKEAVEKVKTLHVDPGKQPDLIRDLAREAENYVEQHNLVTVPPLAKEVWRMSMMTPERQKVNPFFTGGEVIQVSFPTAGMEHDDKLMSMRGNNRHFARATVHHELIPGHHLQQFMTARYNSHRRAFGTPFWTEGWALYWEMLLWDRGFAESPENRVGMLFWRMHRAARILFSLRFHLGQWTPEQGIDFLVDRVGHERANAEAEVRRSFNGTYPPLYQLAYMMGGLQFRALHRELVGGGTMTNRQFHDAILEGGTMPVEMVRARLTRQAPARDHKAAWRFSH